MVRRTCFAAALVLASALASAPAWALPSVQQVEVEVAQGRYAQAEAMMAEVIAARPRSARAHYVYAEILARNELYARAAEHARRARALDPTLAFAGSADRFRDFERRLERAQKAVSQPRVTNAAPLALPALPSPSPAATVAPEPRVAAPAAASTGVPSWLWALGFAVGAVLLWRAFSRRSAGPAAGAASMPVGAIAANSPYGPGGGMAPGAMAPGTMAPMSRGGGLLGAGLAGAGGFAAGMMVDQMLHRRDNESHGGTDRLAGLGPDAGTPLDDGGSDLAGRGIDFGTGGNDWGGDAGGSSDGGSSDGGGGGDGGGWDS